MSEAEGANGTIAYMAHLCRLQGIAYSIDGNRMTIRGAILIPSAISGAYRGHPPKLTATASAIRSLPSPHPPAAQSAP